MWYNDFPDEYANSNYSARAHGTIGKNAFQSRMIIRFDEDGKKYLYDIIDIKKET